MNDIANHYDTLVAENNDPVYDPKPLKAYMDKWDGQAFIDEMQLDKSKAVFELGVGTGRLAVRVAELCGEFTGIDISPKTAQRARDNLKGFTNVTIVCGDFSEYEKAKKYDVIYSSLTFMHIKDKQAAISKVSNMLSLGGKFLLSIDKNQDNQIDTGNSRITVFPDTEENIKYCIEKSGLTIAKQYETEFAVIFSACKPTVIVTAHL